MFSPHRYLCAGKLQPFILAICFFMTHSMATGDTAGSASAPWSELGRSGSALWVEIVQEPFFIGERVVLRVHVRNTSEQTRSLPSPQALQMDMLRIKTVGAPNESMRQRLYSEAHQHCGQVENDVLIAGQTTAGSAACVQHLTERCVPYAPGESRSATWVGPSLRLDTGEASTLPIRYAFFVSTHGLLPDRWAVFDLAPISDNPGKMVSTPSGFATYIWAQKYQDNRYLVLGGGSWHAVVCKPPKNVPGRLLMDSDVRRYADTLDPSPAFEFNSERKLLINGVIESLPQYKTPVDAGDSAWLEP